MPAMTLKNAALLALIGTILITALLVWDFVFNVLNVLRGLIPLFRWGEPDRGRVGLDDLSEDEHERMGDYLSQVALAHPREFIVMVIDGASSHVAKDLVVPENIRLLRLPAYAPELNPQEHVWDEVRKKNFPTGSFPIWPV